MKPSAEDGIKFVAGGAFVPGTVAAVFQLMVLNTLYMPRESVMYHVTRMGIVIPVQHEHRRIDSRKSRRVDSFPLQTEHVFHGLPVTPQIELFSGQRGRFDGVFMKKRQYQTVSSHESAIGITELIRKPRESIPKAVIHSLLDVRRHACP